MSNPSTTLDIESLIPHRLPMRLVEELRTVEQHTALTSAIVRASWPTVEHGQAQTVVLIELIAQSAAALMGWRARHEATREPPGLLVGVPQATCTRSAIPVGTRLMTTVRLTHGFARYGAFEGTVRDETGEVWMQATIQAYRPDEGDASNPGLAALGERQS